uniref:Uncharacterized protein n=1 Tax=Panagrolaimus sp. ES5 TaxID=591445 RepID=A0AC34F3K2_9BILA
MQKLLSEIIKDIYFELFNEKHFIKHLYTVALSGIEALNILENILSSATEISIDDNAFVIKFRNGLVLRYLTSDYHISHFLGCIGKFIEVLEFDFTRYKTIKLTASIIEGICVGKKLKKLSANDCSSISDLKKIVEACSDSLKVFNSDVTSFWCLDTKNLDLESLHLYSLDHTEFRSIVKHKCCRTAVLSLAFLQHMNEDSASADPEYLEWDTLINIFEGINNPTLSTVKKLKLYLSVDGIDDDIRLEEVMLNISETFQSLESVEIFENDSDTKMDQISDMLFIVDGTKLCYHILYDHIFDSNYNFLIDVKWNINFEGFFSEDDCNTFIEKVEQVFDDFEFFESDKILIIRKSEKIKETRNLIFTVNIEKY